ncbi:hypothetical protein PRIPAC_78010 [Pristionchus pacificus]|uniref:Uncharacterized protein n=1 Tax=Pristionchus pacificus TaxID=54126 RepID=A0A2A6CM87_PRIPA|nr:hypothetical protein PRIPAC_78010 [Pristionchus pacificus]|eukprot:PDM79355.1 hypothetical protein PRIPAC_31934 [Pristionchus pacificus]
MLRLFAVCVLAAAVRAQMQPQCTCSVFNPCIATAEGALQQCADRCQSHATELGASIPAVRACIVAHEAQIRQAVACVRGSLGPMCAAGPGHSVPRRFPETMQLAAFRELNGMLTRSGLLGEAQSLMQHGRRALGCMMRCGAQNSCVRRLQCGLELPSDNVIIQNVKSCAARAGFNTAVARQVCGCFVNAGVRVLAPMCSRIVIS